MGLTRGAVRWQELFRVRRYIYVTCIFSLCGAVIPPPIACSLARPACRWQRTQARNIVWRLSGADARPLVFGTLATRVCTPGLHWCIRSIRARHMLPCDPPPPSRFTGAPSRVAPSPLPAGGVTGPCAPEPQGAGLVLAPARELHQAGPSKPKLRLGLYGARS